MSGPTLTLAEAARRCSCSESTIRRKLRADAIEGATRLEDGSWSIPIAGLVAADMLDKTTPPDTPVTPRVEPFVTPPSGTPNDSPVDRLQERIATLEAEAVEHDRRETELRHRAELAEALADERAQALDDARLAMRMLEAGSASQNAPDAETPTAAPDTRPDTSDAARERATGWLRRTFGR